MFTSEHAPHAEILERRFGFQIAARLTQRSMALSPDVNERLRFAREKALAAARLQRAAAGAAPQGLTRGGAAILGRLGTNWWLKVASTVPMLALIAGLVFIQYWQDNTQILVAAEVDAALLADDLPPSAYGDAGFAEFLKTSVE
jgi:hypothetical protein